jgi:hypothetical protein
MKLFRISFFGFRIWGAVLGVLLFTLTGWTTIVIKMDLTALVQQSDTILQGRVEQVYAQWNEPMKTIFTDVSVRVEDTLKGEARRSVSIRQLGGKVGAMNMSIAGMPKFTSGEDVILFLKGNGEGTHHVVGLSQGKFEIVNDFAVADVSGVGLVDSKTGQVIEGVVVAKESLETFKSRIRRLAQ